MRKIFIIFIFLGLIMSSCEKFLEEENLANVKAEDYYVTSTGYKSLIAANYGQLRTIYGGAPNLFCSGTDLYADGRGYSNRGLNDYATLSPSSANVDFLYTECYKLIQLANTAIYYADTTEQTTDLPKLVGEIKFLRALAYFLLVQTYGGVPIVTDYYVIPPKSFERATEAQVYDLIIQDLNDAKAVVSTGAYTGTVNQRAVLNLLGQVYLTRGYESYGAATDFDDAATLFDQVIAGQGLNLTFENLWKPGNEMNTEVIFSVQYSKESQSTDPSNLGNSQHVYFGSYMGGQEVQGKFPLKVYSFVATQFAIDLYEENDTRWNATFMVELRNPYWDYYLGLPVDFDHPVYKYYQPKWIDATELAAYVAAHTFIKDGKTVTVSVRPYGHYASTNVGTDLTDFSSISCKKFDAPDNPYWSNNSSTRDLILHRLGDTYLLAAEAYLMAGDDVTAVDRLNVVRNRAGTGNFVGTLDIDEILNERARELFGEYQRWFDLKRTGKLVERSALYNWQVGNQSSFVGKNGNLKILRPIPQTAIDLNGNANFQQNPAY
jgi:starch-binding outer membrane protein, SusD/RagB family